MTAMLSDLKTMYDRGDTGEYTHMIVLHDVIDFDNYPVYVKPGEDPREVARADSGTVDECYSYALGWDLQSKERRANHWD